MSRTLAAALLISLASLAASPVLAADTPVAQTPTAPAPRAPATSAERTAYERMDALSRSVFWAREMEINPADPVAGVRLAQALREMGQYEQAATTAQTVVVAQPANVEAMLELGRSHIGRGQAFYGIAPLEQARALAPNDWRPLSLLGVAYQQVRRTDDARAAWNDGLRLSPDNPEILTNAAVALTAEGNAPAAETLLRRAVAQPGATLKMRQNLALVLGLQGKTGEAEQIIRRDLPPEMADRNLHWLQDQAVPTPVATTSADSARTWSSLQGQ